MSFDLYFCWRQRERIDFQAVKAWTKGFESFTARNEQLWYSNSRTGVYFSFDFEPLRSEPLEDLFPMPVGFFDSGLSFNLNFNRPSFFAYEAMPIVGLLAARFGLSILNPQTDAVELKLMTALDSEALIRSWIDHNRRAILGLIEVNDYSNVLHMPADSSLYLWKYRRAKDDLAMACGENIFVPSLAPVHRIGEMRVGRVIVYTVGLPMIVPRCEWVFIVTSKKRFFRSRKNEEVRVISAETFQESLMRHIKPFEWPEAPVRIIGTECAEKAGKIVQSIDHVLSRSEFEIIGADSFVDVDLESDG